MRSYRGFIITLMLGALAYAGIPSTDERKSDCVSDLDTRIETVLVAEPVVDKVVALTGSSDKNVFVDPAEGLVYTISMIEDGEIIDIADLDLMGKTYLGELLDDSEIRQGYPDDTSLQVPPYEEKGPDDVAVITGSQPWIRKGRKIWGEGLEDEDRIEYVPPEPEEWDLIFDLDSVDEKKICEERLEEPISRYRV